MNKDRTWYIRPLNDFSAWILPAYFPHVRKEFFSIGDDRPSQFGLSVYDLQIPIQEFAENCFEEFGKNAHFASYCRSCGESLARRHFTYSSRTMRHGEEVTSAHELREWVLEESWLLSEYYLTPTLVCVNGAWVDDIHQQEISFA